MRDNTINLEFGFDIHSQEAIDSRFVLTKYDMEQVGQHDDDPTSKYHTARFPEQYFAILVSSEGEPPQLYAYDKSKIHVNSNDDSKLGGFYRIDYEYIKKHPYINNVEVKGSHPGSYYNLQSKLLEGQGIKLTDTLDSEGKVAQLIEVKVDGKSVQFDANGQLIAIIRDGVATKANVNLAGEPVVDVVVDDKTVKVNAANELELPIDYATIIINSEGKISAVPEPLADGVATEVRYMPGSNVETVNVKFDNDTIKLNANNELYAETQLAEGKANEITSEGIINVLVDDATIKVNGANKLEAIRDEKTIKVGSEGLFVPIDNKTIRISAAGKIVATPESLVDGKATHAYYDSEDEKVDVLVDDVTIKVNGANNLEVKTGEAIYTDSQGIAVKHNHTLITDANNKLGIALVEGDAIDVVNYNEINVMTDNKSIEVDGTNKLAAIYDDSTIKVNSEGLEVNIDKDTIYVDAVTGKLKARQESLIADKAIEIDNVTHKVSVKYDDKSIGLNGSNELEAIVDDKSIVVGSEGIKANIDNKTIKLNSEGKLEAQPIDGKTIIYNANGKLETQIGGWKETTTDYEFANQSGAISTTNPTVAVWNGSFCPEVGSTITCDVQLGVLPMATQTFFIADDGEWVTGSDFSHGYLDMIRFKKDLSVIEYTFDATMLAMGTYDVKSHGDANLYHTVDGKYIPIDNNTIVYNPTTKKLEAVAKDLIAGEAVALGSDGSINVLYDNKTVILNSEGKLAAVPEPLQDGVATEVKYVGDIETVNVKFDNDTIVLNSEGKLKAVAKDLIAGEAIKLGSEGSINVLYDNDTIVLNSEGKLHANSVVRDVQTKVRPATAYSTVVGTDGKAYIDLTDFATTSEAANSIMLTMDSEYKMTLSLFNVLGDLIDEDMIDLPLEEMIIDGRYVDTSEGGYIVLTLKNGNVINVPLDQLVDGLVNLRGAQTIVGSKDFTGKLTRLGQEVLSVLNVDGVTIKWNDSEGFIEATGLEVKAGDGIEVISSGVSSEGKPIKLLNVLTDDKTVKVNANNKLEAMFADGLTLGSEGEKLKVDVDNKTLKIDANKLKVNIDGMTLRYNTSEDWLEATGIDIKAGDAVAINIDSESTVTKIVKRLDVLADEKSIEIDANNKLAAKIDEKTIVLDNSEGLKTRIGGWKEVASAYPFVQYSGTITATTLVQPGQVPTQVPEAGEAAICDVVWDGTPATVVLGMWTDDGLWMKSEDSMASYVKKVRVKKDLTATEVTFDVTKVAYIGSTATVVAKSNSNIYHKVDGKYMPIDNATIMLDANGNMKAVAKDLIGGKAIAIASDSSINVLYDEATICLDSENNLYVPIDGETVQLDSEGKVIIPIDGITIKYNEDTHQIEATGLQVEQGEAIEVINAGYTSEGDPIKKINVKFDKETVILNSEGKLSLPIDRETIILDSEGKLVLPLDEKTIVLNSEGKLEATFQKSEGIKPIEVDSEGKIKLLFDEKTLVLDSEDNLIVPIDEKTLIINSEGKLETRVGGWLEDRIPSFKDVKVSTASSTSPTYVEINLFDSPSAAVDHYNFSGRVMGVSFVQQNIPVADVTVTPNADGSYKYSFSFTNADWYDKFYNDADELVSFDWITSSGSAVAMYRVTCNMKDFRTDASGAKGLYKLARYYVHYIDPTFINVDNRSIILDSEGALSATAKDLFAGEAIEIDNNIINALYDSESIIINSEGELQVLEIPVADIKALWDSLI